MRIRLIHPVIGRVALIAALVMPLALPAGAVVCMDHHGRIAIEGADAKTGRCAGHTHDHCHEPVATACGHGHTHPSAPADDSAWTQADPHGCVDLLVPSDLVRIDRTAAFELPPIIEAALYVQPDHATFVSARPDVTSHPPPWVRAPLSTFIILT